MLSAYFSPFPSQSLKSKEMKISAGDFVGGHQLHHQGGTESVKADIESSSSLPRVGEEKSNPGHDNTCENVRKG